MKPIIPLILKPSHLQRAGTSGRVPIPSKRFIGWFLRELDTRGFAAYRSAENARSGIVLDMEQMEQFTEGLLGNTRGELGRRGLVSPNQLLMETGRHGLETIQAGANLELHQDWLGKRKVIAIVNQQQHGRRFTEGGDRVLADLFDRRIYPMMSRDHLVRQSQMATLPSHLQQ